MVFQRKTTLTYKIEDSRRRAGGVRCENDPKSIARCQCCPAQKATICAVCVCLLGRQLVINNH